MQLLERFLKYVAIDTRSDEDAAVYPSTAEQRVLLEMLAGEMRAMGIADVEIDAYGYATGTVTATAGCENEPTIGFLAHVDTSPDVSGAGVKPQILENYDGGDIILGVSGLTLSPRDFPKMAALKGHTLVTTDGTTLLGADDKAGVAIIMTAAEHLLSHPDIPHGRIRIAFTPDEEVGRGVDHFDVERFGARFAYTVDGGAEGSLEYENFNAASAHVEFRGQNFHPGYARGRMVNALRLAHRFDDMLPSAERPETVDGRDGFFHLTSLCGDVEAAAADYLLRDFTREGLERRKQALRNAAAALGPEAVSLDIRDSYYNMIEVMNEHPEIIERAMRAMRAAGVEPVVEPIRGGTDGARLSFMGLPCPNLFTGGANFHSVREYCSLDTMRRAVQTVVNIATTPGFYTEY